MIAASFSMNSIGSKSRCEVPSRQTVFSVTRTGPSARSWTRCWASGGGGGAAELLEAGTIVGGPGRWRGDRSR